MSDPAPTPSSRADVYWMAAVVVVALVVAGLLYLVLFTAFGTTEGDGDGATPFADGFDSDAGAGLGPDWEQDAGTWTVDEDGRAQVSEPGAAGSAAVVDLGDLPGRISAVAVDPAPGWGLVFRYRDPDEHWYLAVDGDDGLLHLGIVADGRDEDLGAVGTAPVAAMSTVEVRLIGDAVEVRMDDRYLGRRRDDRLRRATGVGLALRGENLAARWDDVVSGPLETGVVVVPPAGP